MSQLKLYTSKQNVTLALAAQLFFGLVETLVAQNFRSGCASAWGAIFMTCAAHLCNQVRDSTTLKLI